MKERVKQKYSILRKVVMIVSACLFVAAFVMLLVITIGEDPNNRLVSVLGAMVLLSLPYLLELIFRFRLSDFILTFYIVYIFFASILGNVVYLYILAPGYDKVMHTLFGYVGCLGGLFALCKLEKNKEISIVTVCIMCFAVSMALGAMWEICEFIGDTFMGQTGQGQPIEAVSGELFTDITDSMLDLICNLGGAIAFVIHYIIHRQTERNLVMGSIIKDFKGAGKTREPAASNSEAA